MCFNINLKFRTGSFEGSEKRSQLRTAVNDSLCRIIIKPNNLLISAFSHNVCHHIRGKCIFDTASHAMNNNECFL